MLPPGRARLATKPSRHRINNARHDDGDRPRRLLRRLDRGRGVRHDDVHLEVDQLGRQIWEPAVLTLGPSGLDGEVLPFNIAQVAQALAERPEAPAVIWF